ncbi:MAG: class I SAM-dependent methyltransferase [Ferrovibrio sp.]|uniref:class I SAM-dependent methyltransferase n=1 Tax=Ferrovibrio sp. TaxID=1917215 RepID=UPI00391DD64A
MAHNIRLVDQCPGCGGEHFKRQVAIGDDNRERFHRFSKIKYGGLLDSWVDVLKPEIVACTDCGHHWYLRQPSTEQLSEMYANGRRLLVNEISREPGYEMIAEMRRLVRLVGKRSPRLLDFGSGFGRWARAAARAGFQVHAYEPSTARGAESVDEFTLVHDLAEIDGMKFDAINLEQVLEHVPAPLDTLHQIRAYMEPNSILRIRVPNITRSLEGPEIWRVWPYDGTHVHVMAPFEHLHGFTPESFIALSRRADLRVISGLRFAFTHPKAWFREVVRPISQKWASTSALLVDAQRRTLER